MLESHLAQPRFLIHHINGQVQTRRFLQETNNTECRLKSIQASYGVIMARVMFLWAILGPIVP